MAEEKVETKPEVKPEPATKASETPKNIIDAKAPMDDDSPEAQAQAAEDIIKRAQTDPSVLDDPMVKAFYDQALSMISKGKPGDKPEDKVEPGEEGDKPEDKPEDKKPEDKAADDKEDDNKEDKKEDKPEGKEDKEEKEDEGDDDSVLLTKGKKAPKIESMEDALSHTKDNFSIDDLGTLMTSAEKWRADSNNLATSEKNYNDVKDALAGLPPSLYEAVEASWRGGDWQKVIDEQGGRINFSKSFEEQDEWDILTRYFGPKIVKLQKDVDDETITKEDFEARVNDLSDAAEPLFKNEQTKWQSQRDTIVQQQEEVQESFKASVGVSVDSLKSDIPGFSNDKHRSKLDAIRNILVRNELGSLFYNADGTLKKEAAKAVFYAKYGEEETERLTKIAENRGKTKATEDYVDRADKKPAKSKSGGAEDTAVIAQKKVLETHLKPSQLKKNPLEHQLQD